MKGELKMLNVKLERYLNDFWRKVEAKSFASLSELENWIFDQMQQDYSSNTGAMSFPTPASARKIHADGPWAIKFQPEAAIFGPDEDLSAKTLQKIILDGRFTPDGDSYIPEPAAEQFNEDYGTKHPVRDIGFEM